MIVALKFVGILLIIVPVIGYLVGLVGWVPPVWGVIMLGFAFAAIPREYSLSLFRIIAWLIILLSAYVIGSGAYGSWGFVAFLAFALSGMAAGLRFVSNDSFAGE